MIFTNAKGQKIQFHATHEELNDAMGIYETGHGNTWFRLTNLDSGEVRKIDAGYMYGDGFDEVWERSYSLDHGLCRKYDHIPF